MGLEIIHLELDTVLEAIELHLRWTNTKPAYLNKSNLQFILDTTKTRFNSDEEPLQKKASFMLTQIVKSHPLADGNKRAAVILTDTFVGINGAQIIATDDEIFEKVTSFAAGKITENDIRKWLEEKIR
jgi:death on curing protein